MMSKMRIKAVLRDAEILRMDEASVERVEATARKNMDRPVNLASLLKVMGIDFSDRTTMLEKLRNTGLHIWLLNIGNQDVIFISESESPDLEETGYKWQ